MSCPSGKSQKDLGTEYLESKTGPNWRSYELPVVGGDPMTSGRNILCLLRFQAVLYPRFSLFFYYTRCKIVDLYSILQSVAGSCCVLIPSWSLDLVCGNFAAEMDHPDTSSVLDASGYYLCKQVLLVVLPTRY
jgi:hypothetical protein